MTPKPSQWFANLRRAFSSRYVRMLEIELMRAREDIARGREEVTRIREEVTRERAEVERERAEIARLRLENRALLNSLLGTAGVPPVEEPRTAPPVAPVRRHFWRPQP